MWVESRPKVTSDLRGAMEGHWYSYVGKHNCILFAQYLFLGSANSLYFSQRQLVPNLFLKVFSVQSRLRLLQVVVKLRSNSIIMIIECK